MTVSIDERYSSKASSFEYRRKRKVKKLWRKWKKEKFEKKNLEVMDGKSCFQNGSDIYIYIFVAKTMDVIGISFNGN